MACAFLILGQLEVVGNVAHDSPTLTLAQLAPVNASLELTSRVCLRRFL